MNNESRDHLSLDVISPVVNKFLIEINLLIKWTQRVDVSSSGLGGP